MSQQSCRSSFDLQLFSSTPISYKCSNQNLADVFREVALSHLIRLRSMATPGNRPFFISSLQRTEYEHMRDTAFWFGVIVDTARPLSLRQPPILPMHVSGLQGEEVCSGVLRWNTLSAASSA